MKNKILFLASITLSVIFFSACSKKKHEVMVTTSADTVKTTVVINQLVVDTIYLEPEDTVFVNTNNLDIRNIYVAVNENTPNGSTVLTFDNTNNQEYIIKLGSGFEFIDNKLVVSNQSLLDYETTTSLEILAEVSKNGEQFPFKILVGVKDVVDVSELKSHFNFDEKNLEDLVSGNSLIPSLPVVYSKVHGFENYYINFSGNDNNEVLEWGNNIIDLNKDFSICFFAVHRIKNGVAIENILAGYDDLGNQIIRLYFEQGDLKVEVNGDIFNELSYSFFTPTKSTHARVALSRSGDTYTLRVNDNGSKDLILEEPDLIIPDVTHWSFGAEKSPGSMITNEYSGRLDNIRFYQKEILLSEYQSIISVDF